MKLFTFATLAALSITGAALADSIQIVDPYARSSSPTAKSGAAFLEIHNAGSQDDTLIAVQSDVAARVELHTHKMDANGMMRMVQLEKGITIPAGDTHVMKRGGDHVMLMGLNRSLQNGDVIDVIFVFEKAGKMTVSIPVDQDRRPKQDD